MITQRQIDFRNEYRSRIVGWYNGYFHIALIYAMGAAVLYIYVSHIHDVTPLRMAHGAADVPVHQHLRMAGAQIRHAPPGQHQRPARDLRAAHAQSPPVLQRRGNALPRRQGLARDRIPALCAGRVHADVDPACRAARPYLLAECRLAVHHRHHRHVSDLRVHAFLLSRRRGLVRQALSRWSTRCGVIIPRITMRG